MASIKSSLTEAMKSAMKAGEKRRLGAIRLALADFKRIEVDERIEIDDTRGIAILDKMVKQRRDSLKQYQDAGRDDLAEQESFEIEVLTEFLPAQLSETEILAAVDEAVSAAGASSMADMGKVMGQLKPKLAGKADMGQVSKLVKQRLAG